MPTQLTTERLLLRPLGPADFEAVREFAADPEVWLWIGRGVSTEEQTRDFLRECEEKWQADPQVAWHFAVTLRETGDVAGTCDLRTWGDRSEALTGYAYQQRYWGQGYATEALRALLDFGFGELGFHRIAANVWAPNLASARVLEKAGMTREGCRREAALKDGQWYDLLQYAMLQREWEAACGSS